MRRPLASFVLAILSFSSPGIAQNRLLRIDMPVAWQLTRSLALGKGSTTLTESFRETWVLEMSPNGLINLISPRASVPAFAGPQAFGMVGPHSLALREGDFARLVGVQPQAYPDSEEADSSPLATKLVLINLGRTPRGGNDINLNWSDEAHYGVHIEVGTQVAI